MSPKHLVKKTRFSFHLKIIKIITYVFSPKNIAIRQARCHIRFWADQVYYPAGTFSIGLFLLHKNDLWYFKTWLNQSGFELVVCIRDLDKLNLSWWFGFRLEPILANDPATPQKVAHQPLPNLTLPNKINIPLLSPACGDLNSAPNRDACYQITKFMLPKFGEKYF